MIKLRDYQIECIKCIRNHFIDKNSQIIQLPTGAGKTIVFLSYINELRKQFNGKYLIVCPTVDLQEQIRNEATLFFHISEIATQYSHKNKKLYIITTASLNFIKWDKEFHKFDLVVFDEAHRSASNTYRKFIFSYRKIHDFKLLGVTATPERSDRQNLLEIFGNLTFERNVVDMIEEGYLSDLKSYRVCTNVKINSSDVRNGEFKSTVYKMLDNASRNEIIYKTFIENCSSKKTLIFCLSIKHCEEISNHLNSLGYDSAFIHGRMSHIERRSVLNKFKKGEIKVLTNCQLLTEGFDEPSIESLMITKPTRSKSLYCQMIGRGLRKHPGKKFCELYELTDNAFKICTFDVAAGEDPENYREYKAGTFLTHRRRELIEMKNIETNIVPIDFFNRVDNESQYIILNSLNPTKQQLDQIKKYEIKIDKKYLSFLEVSFIIFKEKLKEKYGFSNKKNN